MRPCAKVFDYLDAGADDEITIRRNKDAYSQLELHYHILAGRGRAPKTVVSHESSPPTFQLLSLSSGAAHLIRERGYSLGGDV